MLPLIYSGRRYAMKTTLKTCISCKCKTAEHYKEGNGQEAVTELFVFECGSRQKEVYSKRSSEGRVEFCGGDCCCADEVA
jgi:hypothetical protein